jgi:rare lipoprotein A
MLMKRLIGVILALIALSMPANAATMLASYYGGHERLNTHTASGERFRPGGLTVAHRSLPFGVRLRICFRGCIVARVSDRGPAAYTGRSLDVSRGVAARIGLLAAGVGRVSVTRLD